MPRTHDPMILVVEDDDDDRFMIRIAFKKSDIRGDLRFVHDGEELMDFLRSGNTPGNGPVSARPALVVLDLNMPRKNGREVLAEIRADGKFADLPVMILTTSNEPKDKDFCAELGVVDYVIKPSDLDGLLKMMETINRHRNDNAVPRGGE